MRRTLARFTGLVPSAVMLSALVLATVLTASVADPAPVSLDAAIAKSMSGSDLRLGRTLASTSAWTRKAVTWRGDGLALTGTATIPRGRGPFPVVVLAHGYIDPAIYTTGRGFAREQDWLARNDVIAFHVDYRNHAGSGRDPRNEIDGRLGYAADVITAALAIQQARPAHWDADRIALMGRSMGGAVAMNALIIRPGLFDAGIMWSSVSSLAAENFDRWQRKRYPLAGQIAKAHGLPGDNPAFWTGISPRSRFDRITEPVLMFHGTSDDSCPVRWARASHEAMQRAGVDVRYVEHPGEGHNFYAKWDDSMMATKRFLQREAGWA